MRVQRRGVDLAAAGVLLAFARPAPAARRMSPQQLQQTLTSAQSAHRKDTDLVVQLADIELNARVSPEELEQLLAISPGPKTAAELQAIADASVFLDPPPGEIPATPAPDVATQKLLATEVQRQAFVDPYGYAMAVYTPFPYSPQGDIDRTQINTDSVDWQNDFQIAHNWSVTAGVQGDSRNFYVYDDGLGYDTIDGNERYRADRTYGPGC